MNKEFLELMRELKDNNYKVNPNVVTMKALYQGLLNTGFLEDEAGLVIGNIKFNVNENFVMAEEFTEILECFAQGIRNLYEEVNKININIFWEGISTQDFHLTYTY
jgi:hypothetical protein